MQVLQVTALQLSCVTEELFRDRYEVIIKLLIVISMDDLLYLRTSAFSVIE